MVTLIPATPPLQTTSHQKEAIWYDRDGIGWDVGYVLQFERFRNTLAGSLICAWDTGYDKTRKVWTAIDDCWPAAMARCANAEDIQICLTFAQQNNLPVAIRVKPAPIDRQFAENGVLILDTSACGAV